MNDSFIAINITYNKEILNNSEIPIILYWNFSDNLCDIFQKDDKFFSLIKQICNNIDIYQFGKISTILVNSDSEETKTNSYLIQDIFDIKLFEELFNEIVSNVFNELYKYVYKKDYEFNKLISIEDNLKSLYTEIENQYKDKMNANTAYHYFMSEVKKKYELNEKNLNEISQFFENILNI